MKKSQLKSLIREIIAETKPMKPGDKLLRGYKPTENPKFASFSGVELWDILENTDSTVLKFEDGRLIKFHGKGELLPPAAEKRDRWDVPQPWPPGPVAEPPRGWGG